MDYPNLVDRAELKADVGLSTTSTTADAAIDRAIAAASVAIQDLAGQPLKKTAGVVLDVQPVEPTIWIPFDVWPIRSIESIRILNPADPTDAGVVLADTPETIAAKTGIRVDAGRYEIGLSGGWAPTVRYRLSLTVGPDDAPPDVVDICKQIAAVLLRNFAIAPIGQSLVGVSSISENDGSGGWTRSFSRKDLTADQLAIVRRYAVGVI